MTEGERDVGAAAPERRAELRARQVEAENDHRQRRVEVADRLHRLGDDGRQLHREQEQRQAEGDADEARIDERLGEAAGAEPAGDLPDAVGPAEEVEDDDVDRTVENALRPQNGVFERESHEPRIGKHGGEPQRAQPGRFAVADRQTRRENGERVREDGRRERPGDAAQNGGVERPLEGRDDQAGRDHDKDEFGQALHARLVENARLARKRPEAHQQKEDKRLPRRDAQPFDHQSSFILRLQNETVESL